MKKNYEKNYGESIITISIFELIFQLDTNIHVKFVKKNECKRKCSLDLEELVVAGLIKRGHRRTIINQRVSNLFFELQPYNNSPDSIHSLLLFFVEGIS